MAGFFIFANPNFFVSEKPSHDSNPARSKTHSVVAFKFSNEEHSGLVIPLSIPQTGRFLIAKF